MAKMVTIKRSGSIGRRTNGSIRTIIEERLYKGEGQKKFLINVDISAIYINILNLCNLLAGLCWQFLSETRQLSELLMPNDKIIDSQTSGEKDFFNRPPFSERLFRPLLAVSGFTLIELIVVSAIIGVLATIAIPMYKDFLRQAKEARAKQEVRLLETEIVDYLVNNGSFPATLADIGRDSLKDPWEHPYQYSPTPVRVDRFFNDLNPNDFDVYSMGNDGLTEDDVFGGTGKDDVLRGANGAFVGLGADW